MTENKKSFTKRMLIVAGMTVGVVALSVPAMARPGGPPHRGMGGMGGMMGGKIFRLLRDLDLTEEQEIKAIRLKRKMRKEAKAIRQQDRELMKSALAELEKANPDVSKLHSIVDQRTANANKMAKKAISNFMELHAMLTAEQRATLKEHAQEAMERMEMRKKGKRGRRGRMNR